MAEIEIHELTEQEWEAGKAATLDRLGCTEAELEEMAATGKYASPRHRKTWLATRNTN